MFWKYGDPNFTLNSCHWCTDVSHKKDKHFLIVSSSLLFLFSVINFSALSQIPRTSSPCLFLHSLFRLHRLTPLFRSLQTNPFSLPHLYTHFSHSTYHSTLKCISLHVLVLLLDSRLLVMWCAQGRCSVDICWMHEWCSQLVALTNYKTRLGQFPWESGFSKFFMIQVQYLIYSPNLSAIQPVYSQSLWYLDYSVHAQQLWSKQILHGITALSQWQHQTFSD